MCIRDRPLTESSAPWSLSESVSNMLLQPAAPVVVHYARSANPNVPGAPATPWSSPVKPGTPQRALGAQSDGVYRHSAPLARVAACPALLGKTMESPVHRGRLGSQT